MEEKQEFGLDEWDQSIRDAVDKCIPTAFRSGLSIEQVIKKRGDNQSLLEFCFEDELLSQTEDPKEILGIVRVLHREWKQS